MNDTNSHTILDVGCGDRPRGTTNLDLTERDVDNFVKGDATDLPFEDNSFDTVYSSGLSLWSQRFEDDMILTSWREAIRVARHQVVFEYNYNKPSDTWTPKDPFYCQDILREEISPDIEMEYSERGKMAKIIRPFEKVFGTKFTIFVLNSILRRSFYAKFSLKLTNEENIPETTLGVV